MTVLTSAVMGLLFIVYYLHVLLYNIVMTYRYQENKVLFTFYINDNGLLLYVSIMYADNFTCV